MKLKDIKVGEEYAVGTRNNNERMTAVEVGVHGSVWHGFGRFGPSARADYVRCRSFTGRMSVEPCRSFLRTWAEHEPIKAQVDRELAEKRRRQAEAKALRAAAPKLLEAARAARDYFEAGTGDADGVVFALQAAIEEAEGGPDPGRVHDVGLGRCFFDV